MEKTTKKAKIFSGKAVSDKMKDTVVVLVESYTKHPRYGKYIRGSKKFKVHDQGNTKKVGDKVTFVECKPISKEKKFIVVS